MVQLDLYQGERAKVGADVALTCQLHMPDYGWQLRPRLLTVSAGDYRGVVALARVDGKPVACVLVRLTRDQKSGWDIAAYCKDEHRRKGLCSKLITELRNANVPIPAARFGIFGSDRFWASNSIPAGY